MNEMRRLLGVLRDDPESDTDELSPAPGLDRLPQLVARVAEATEIRGVYP